MADHVRRQIREAVTTLLTGLPTTGSRVFASRLYPLQEADLPALRIYTDAEETSALTLDHPVIEENSLDVIIEGVAKATAALDDSLDGIDKEVRGILGAALTPAQLGGAQAFNRTGAEIEFADEGQQPIGMIRMQYRATYIITANTPDIAH